MHAENIFVGLAPGPILFNKIILRWLSIMILGVMVAQLVIAVATNSRGPRFESSHQQKFILNIYCQLYSKDENKEKEAWNGPFFKKKYYDLQLKSSMA